MRRRFYRGGCVVALLAAGLALQACAPPFYCAKSVHGRVVDAETQQPLTAAVIVAEWVPMTVVFPDRTTPLHVAEDVTDANGNYSIPGWGPRFRWPLTRLRDYDPELILFKSGYRPRFLFNHRDRNGFVRSSDWDSKTVPLHPFRGTPTERLAELKAILGKAAWDRRMPPMLCEEMLKERSLAGPSGKLFFDNLLDLRGSR